MVAEVTRHPRPRRRLATAIVAVLLASLLAIALLYALRIPGLDPITIWPFTLWAGLFMTLGIVLAPLLGLKRGVLVIGMPLLAALLVCEEPRFMLKSPADAAPVQAAAQRGKLLRVISLNCGGGNTLAVQEAFALDPDVILLQESPGTAILSGILPEGWRQVGGGDCWVLVRGKVTSTEHSRDLANRMHVALATPSRLAPPRPIAIISVHIVHPSLRPEIWRPSVWREAEAIRQARATRVETMLREGDRYGEDLPVILGGDFNTGDHDSLLLPLEQAGFTDAFVATGSGCPNTIVSDFPLERIDYVWANERFAPLSARIVFTPHSDHRMVVAELAVR
ncbi:MAG TPA: hypothetical protein DEP45_13075 [Armatimonadetes bacterium]|nr:hypothetical protein [Armatimonadota bacterium]